MCAREPVAWEGGSGVGTRQLLNNFPARNLQLISTRRAALIGAPVPRLPGEIDELHLPNYTTGLSRTFFRDAAAVNP